MTTAAPSTERPFVSVIVPCYNLAGYVERCAFSLLAQTYPHYEVLLVDDGSTDGTGALLRPYAECDQVQVLTKPNGGLSDARNYGVAAARGDYVTFVDGDDVVSPYYLESLVSGVVPGRPTLVASHFHVVPDAQMDELDWARPAQAKVLSKGQFGQQLLYETVTESGWGKLAPRQVYLDTPFPVGKVYEDMATVMSYVNACETFSLVEEPIYGYAMRAGSIINGRGSDSAAVTRRGRDYLDAWEIFFQAATETFPEEADALAYRACLTASRIHALVGGARTPEAKSIDQRVRDLLRDYLPTVQADPQVSHASKARFALLNTAPHVYRGALRTYEKIAKRV